MTNKKSKSKVEKKLSIKSFLRKGKRVKAFRRKQKVNREESKNRLLIGLGTTATLGVGGLAAAKLIKNAKNKKLANAARNVPKATTVPSPQTPKPSAPAPTPAAPKSNLELRTDIPDSVKPFLDDYGYNPPKEPLLPNARKPESYQSIVSNTDDIRTVFYTPGSIGYVIKSGKNVQSRTKSLLDNVVQKQGAELKDFGATAQFLELEDGSGFILQVEKTPKIQKGAVDNRIGSFFFSFKIPKDVDPRYIDLKPFDDLITPGNEGYNEELFKKFMEAYNPEYRDLPFDKNLGLTEANSYMLDFLKKSDWKPLDQPNPKVKNAIDIRVKSKDNFDKRSIWT